MEVNPLEGKVAIVTGGASGIGLAIAERLTTEGVSLLIANKDAHGGLAAAKQTWRSVSRERFESAD